MKEAISELLKRDVLDLSAESVEARLAESQWHTIDDNYLLVKFREALDSLSSSAGAGVVCDHLRAILFRRPAKLVYQWEALAHRDSNDAKLKERVLRSEIKQVIERLGLDENRFHIIPRKPFPFSTSLPRSSGELSYGEKARSVSILQKNKRKSTLLTELPNMLVSSLFDHRKYSLRVLYLPQNGEEKSIREDLRRELADLKI